MVDDYSKYIWTFLLTTNADTVVVLRDFLMLGKTQFNKTIKCIIIDNGTKFFNEQVSSLLRNFGIQHQSSCVYSPQQNRVVERRRRTILDMVRALIFQAHVTFQYWGHCVSITVYLLNRVPSQLFRK